jgi:16S rRNA (guanine966-N2)-methyltransferase
MRITGGQARGIPIKAPRGMRTRPTSDKVREAMFGVLGKHVVGATVLDLFAGSGALGIEALSRGAIRVIEDNLAKARFSEKGEIIRADFRSAIRKLEKADRKFDLIFVDPPYESALLKEVTIGLAKYCITSDETIVIVEHFKKNEPPPSIVNIPLVRTRTYGQTALSYFGVLRD